MAVFGLIFVRVVANGLISAAVAWLAGVVLNAPFWPVFIVLWVISTLFRLPRDIRAVRFASAAHRDFEEEQKAGNVRRVAMGDGGVTFTKQVDGSITAKTWGPVPMGQMEVMVAMGLLGEQQIERGEEPWFPGNLPPALRERNADDQDHPE